MPGERHGHDLVRMPGLAPARLAGTLLGAAGFLVAAASVLLPWVRVPAGVVGAESVTWTGLDDPDDLGLLCVAAAALGLGLLLPTVLPRGRWLGLGALAAAVVIAALGDAAIGERVVGAGGSVTVDVEAAEGAFVLLCGAALATVGSVVVLVTPRRVRVRVPWPAAPAPAAGWYPDPGATAALRWWSGDGWTEHVAGTVSADRGPAPLAVSAWGPPDPAHRRG